jgi:branched-chain amino acid transport system substrate-binding protein
MELKIGVLTLQSNAVPGASKNYLSGLRLALANTSVDVKYVLEGMGVGTEVDLAIEKIEKLVMQEEVDIIVGMAGHRSIPRIRSTGNSLWLPMIISDFGATMPIGLCKSDGFYSLSLDRWHSSYLLGEYLVKNNGGQVGVATSFYDSGYGIVEGLERGLYKAGGNFLGHYVVPHKPREDEAECFKEVATALGENPLFALQSGVFAMEFGESLKALGNDRTFPIYATTETVSNEVLSEFGDCFEGTKVFSTWAKELDTVENLKFIDALKTKYKKDPDEFSLLGYETGLAIATALELVNEDEMDEDALIAALDKVNVEGPRGNLSFSPELNRCLNDHHIFEVCKKEDGHALRFVETVKADEKYFYEVCNEEVSLKRGGWFNAYLCH